MDLRPRATLVVFLIMRQIVSLGGLDAEVVCGDLGGSLQANTLTCIQQRGRAKANAIWYAGLEGGWRFVAIGTLGKCSVSKDCEKKQNEES
eukprot:4447287-Pleurochrysis_carterae.AAC.3